MTVTDVSPFFLYKKATGAIFAIIPIPSAEISQLVLFFSDTIDPFLLGIKINRASIAFQIFVMRCLIFGNKIVLGFSWTPWSLIFFLHE